MAFTVADRDIIRTLATQVAEIAALPSQQKTIGLWKRLNGLKPIRPMVMIDQVCWHEMNVDDELTPRTQDRFCRGIENKLRQIIYRHKHMPVDMAVESYIEVPKAIRNTGYGITVEQNISKLDPQNDVVGHLYLDGMKTDADIDRIQTPQVSLDQAATDQAEQKAHELLDGILDVRMQGMLPWIAPWDVIAMWRGVEGILTDLIERPDFMDRLVSRLVDAYMAMIDSLEAQGLLGFGQQYIHCTGAWTDELPKAGFNPRKPRLSDLWAMGMAQIFGSVSPAMHDRFEIPYMQRIYRRFGLGYYGCCEPLDDRLDLVRKIPNVRKISMSAWVNQDRGARQIGPDYVFSRKPSPAMLARDRWDVRAVEDDLRQTVRICKEHGCPLELILKDISTVRYQPQRLWEWAAIAMKVVQDQ